MEAVKYFAMVILVCGGCYGATSDLSSETVQLREKLNLILNAESREVTLLKNLLDEAKEHEGEEDLEITSTAKSVVDGKSVEYLREQGIVGKLEENSKRMEKMVVFLVDLRNLLTEAITQQNREMEGENELIEMREEMEYLRKEVQTLKKQQEETNSKVETISQGSVGHAPSMENQLHNEHATVEWLKESTHELRTQIKELSDQCNATLIVSLKDRLEVEGRKREENLGQAERQLESFKVGLLKQQQAISECQGDVRDLREWQAKMAERMIKGEGDAENSVEEEDRGFITEALKDAVGKPSRHQSHKRMKSKIHQLQTLIQDVLTTNKNHERRLSKLETSQRTLKSLISSTSPRRSQRSVSSGRSIESLEKTMEEYVLTLERLNDKVSGMDDIQDTTTQLFRSFENLEKKYDDRVSDIQTALARLESGMSGVTVTNEDLKEQQSQQVSNLQAMKKDVFQLQGSLQSNRLRLAALQTQLVKWVGHKCADENSESIQNIRIASLEHAVLDRTVR